MGIDDDTDDFADLDLPLLHDRTYRVRSYKRSDTELLLRGMVRDRKPAGLYIPEDTEALVVHHMVVDMVVELPSMLITEARAVLETHPHDHCPRIEQHYANLVGLSIARGFTHRVRELFGGPRGCTHTTALLQAMAPVAIQSIWSMRALNPRNGEQPVAPPTRLTPEERLRTALAFNLNTCHVWAEDGEMVDLVRQGQPIPPPVWAERRLAELGRDPAEFHARFGEE